MKKYRYSNNPEDYFKNGIDKYEQKDYAGALSDFTVAIELNSKFAEAHYFRGLLYGKEFHNYSKAIKDFSKAIKLKSDYAEAYYNRGVTHVILDDIKKSCEDLHKAKELGFEEANALIERYCNKFKEV
jgi:tetratricopeptide (TPR) repeat protein